MSLAAPAACLSPQAPLQQASHLSVVPTPKNKRLLYNKYNKGLTAGRTLHLAQCAAPTQAELTTRHLAVRAFNMVPSQAFPRRILITLNFTLGAYFLT